jgi:RHS repeat-associated protein
VGNHSFTYDAENKLTAYDGGATVNGGANYYYDGEGRRVKKVVGVSMTAIVFVYDIAGQLIAEYKNAAPGEVGGTSYLTSDSLGTPRVISGLNQEIKARHDYLPFGEELFAGTGGRTTAQGYVGDSVRQKFTQKERDIETGLDYFEARYYASTQGRFTSPDEFRSGAQELYVIGSGDGEKQALAYADIFSPQSLNKYQYCLNNPLRYIDPDGHDWRIIEEKDKEGRLIKRYIWDANYTYKKGDRNGAPPRTRYIDTQGRAIQLWGYNEKDPTNEQTHGYQVVTAEAKGEDAV